MVMQLISVLFSLWVLTISFYQTVCVLSDLETFWYSTVSIWRAEYRLRLCSEFLAVDYNFADAARYLGKEFPHKKTDFETKVSSVGASAKGIYMKRNTLIGRGDLCEEDEIPHLMAGRHKEYNPDVPKGWPNWVARFYER